MVDVSQAQVPHFRWPFRIDPDGTAAVVEQDSADDVTQCVQVLLATRPGERVELPEYGTPDPVFAVATQHAEILAAAERWEPRATLADLETFPDSVDELIRHVRSQVT